MVIVDFVKGIKIDIPFPTGMVVKDGTLYIYYGCADKYVGLATENFEELLQDIVKEKV